MKRILLVLLCVVLLAVDTCASAATVRFWTEGEYHSNGIDFESRCKKSTDGDKHFYVTIEKAWAYNSADKYYFGPRRDYGNGSYSGALSDGLGWWAGRDTRQKRKYTKSAPGDKWYVLNVKEHTSGPGAFFSLYVAWTP